MADKRSPRAITAISVKGFKSFAEEQRVEISPLTLLAGANSSGKSSLIQPLLLLKQTFEAGYDPGPLLLHGSHVRFAKAEQILSKLNRQSVGEEFSVGFESDKQDSILEVFRRSEAGYGFDLVESELSTSLGRVFLRYGERNLSAEAVEVISPVVSLVARVNRNIKWDVVRLRCFLSVAPSGSKEFWGQSTPELVFGGLLRKILHVPGVRGNPERSYNTSAVGDVFPGTFENYVASIILAWQETSDKRLGRLEQALQALGLTWKIKANPLDATRVELLVARLPKKGKSAREDLVNIADVGFGVSQVLPILVALLTAEPRQLVYIEQPELHLHPRAEQALATILADAAIRDVRVVVETHSSILLRGIQTLVAEGKLPPDKVKLHWFQRDSRGATQITSGELDELGAFGDWPVDFDVVEANVDNAYLDAVETRAFQSKKKHARK